MGWRGNLKSINGVINRLEREAKRKQREIELEEAEYEVNEFEAVIERLTGLHRKSFLVLDWEGLSKEPAPIYKPSFFDKILGRHAKKMAGCEERIEAHKKAIAFAQRIIGKDLLAYKELVRTWDLFQPIKALNAQVDCSFNSELVAQIILIIQGEEIIPKEKKSLLQSGKLSVKKMPKCEFYDYFQDHVCSCSIGAASEIFALLPSVKEVFVDVVDFMLNTTTGHLEETTILSVKIPRATLRRLNLSAVDASDCMQNFIHNMSFNKRKGFSSVKPLRVACM